MEARHSNITRNAQRILLVRLSALGDVLDVLPALSALRERFPHAGFSWICEEISEPILRGHPDLEKVWLLPRKRWQKRIKNPAGLPAVLKEAAGLFRRLRQERLSLSLDFQGNLRGAVVSKLSGPELTVGFNRLNSVEGNHLFHSFRIPPVPQTAHRVDRNLAVARFLGSKCSWTEPRLPGFTWEKRWAENTVAGLPKPVFLFHPGVSPFGAFKAWTEEGFARLGDMLSSAFKGTCVLSWGPGEREQVERIAGMAEHRLACAPESPTIRHLAALISRVDVLVTPDTGVLHLADTLRTPVVGLFGPKDPAVYGPRNAEHRIVTSKAPCSPCERRDCNDRRCMKDITAGMVFEAVKDLVRAKGHVKI